jgi:adenylate cyclase class IV
LYAVRFPHISNPGLQVSVKILGGLMALGYEIGSIMRRTSHIFRVAASDCVVKVDEVHNLGSFVQVRCVVCAHV